MSSYCDSDADGSVIRPLPRVKRLLSEPSCLPHIVQLLLTFDPILVEKVATLLTAVVKVKRRRGIAGAGLLVLVPSTVQLV